MVFWNHRMNLLTGESKYVDVLERTLYNGALDGISLKGDRFFYGNPLASSGKNQRKAWFGTACCPANIARLIASLGNYIYAQNDQGIWINLFVGSSSSIPVGKTKVPISLLTDYPWDGQVKISISPERKTRFALHVRIPGWVQGEAVPGGLYRFTDTSGVAYSIQLNGHEIACKMEKGYAIIERQWQKGDLVKIRFPMEVRQVISRSERLRTLD